MFNQYQFDELITGKMKNVQSKVQIMKALSIISNEIECSQCGNHFSIRTDVLKAIGVRYWCKNCSKRFAVRKFTPFAELRLDIGDILQIIALFTANTSVKEICEKVSHSNAAVTKVLTLVRKAIHAFMDSASPILGNESIVEIDETLIAKKRKYNKGREVNAQWLFGAIEREGGHLFLKTVDNRDAKTLGNLIKDHINENATVYSDQWAAYIKFFSETSSYNHKTINHSTNFVSPEDSDVHTQTIESLWGILKRWLRNKNYSRRDKLELYLAEFLFRRLLKNLQRNELFVKIIDVLRNK